MSTCAHCKQSFEAKTPRARFSSTRCRVAAHRAKHRPTLMALRNGQVAVTGDAQRPVGVDRHAWVVATLGWDKLRSTSGRTLRRIHFVCDARDEADDNPYLSDEEREAIKAIAEAMDDRSKSIACAEREVRAILERAIIRHVLAEARGAGGDLAAAQVEAGMRAAPVTGGDVLAVAEWARMPPGHLLQHEAAALDQRSRIGWLVAAGVSTRDEE